jgi:diguanylate cyclase (GGDEF)-like protein/PAS domain S-box-containing protein
MQGIENFLSVVPNPMILVDTQGVIELANEHACSLFGYAPGELTGKSVAALLPERHREKHAKHLEAYFQSPYAREMGTGMELTACRADGSEFPVEISLNLFRGPAGVYTLASVRLIADRKATEVRIRHLNRILAMQGRINALIVRVHDRDEIFREACRIAVEAGAFRMAWIGLLDVDTQEIRVAASFGERAREYLEGVELEAPIQRGPAGVSIRENRPVWIQDYQHSPLTEPWHERSERFGWNSLAVLPLHCQRVPIGAMVLYAGEIGAFDEEEERLLVEMAGNLSFAIDHVDNERMLRHLAHYDALTNLANRTRFLRRVTRHLRNATNGGHKLAVLELDLERFTNINDSLGRPAGDEILKQVAKWLTQEVGDPSLLARLDADHFAVVIPEIAREGDAALLVEQWMKSLHEHAFGGDDDSFRIHAKVGISIYPEDGVNAETLLKHAKAALKQAKASRNRYLFHTPKMTEMMAGKFVLENQLRQALERQEFVLHYQPKVNMMSGALTGAEALIRWNDPRTGLVPPDRFIPMLEETGLIYEVGRWALDQTIEHHRRWRRAGLPAIRIAVNVSPLQLRNRHFIGDIERAIGNDPEAARGLEFEITESMIMEDIEYSIATLRTIRAMGITIALDDFGTGFSSLSYLSKLPLDTLKIDRSFVVDLTGEPERLAQVSAIINLAHSMHLHVVAEGVETADQARTVRMLGADEMQGFLLSKALPIEVFEARFLGSPAAVCLTSLLDFGEVHADFIQQA